MALYFASYDLRGQRDYSKLYQALQSLNAVQVLESTYCFKHEDTTATRIREFFQKVIDNDDGVCVTQVDDWATYNTDATPNDI